MEFLNTVALILDSPVRLSIPLMFASLAGLYSERAGVFDIGFRSGNRDNYEFTMQLAAFSGLEAMAEGPLNNKKNSSFLVSYRQ